jgi:hypothetical protein
MCLSNVPSLKPNGMQVLQPTCCCSFIRLMCRSVYYIKTMHSLLCIVLMHCSRLLVLRMVPIFLPMEPR